MELRCASRILFGILDEDETIEVKCRSARCGHGQGNVVLHVFSTKTGLLVRTHEFRNPPALERT